VIDASHRPLSDNTQHLRQTDIHATGGIRNRNAVKRATADTTPYTEWPLGSASDNILVSHIKYSRPWNINISVSIPQPVISEMFLSLSSYLYFNLCEILGFRYGTVEVPPLLGRCRGKYIGFISSVKQ